MKLSKTEQSIIDQLDLSDGPQTVTNLYTGRTEDLDAQGVALYDFIHGCEILGNYKQFDAARYLFAKLYPSAYMTLID